MSGILIIEDDPDIALGLREDLARHGYEVEVARDGDAGLRRAREAMWDVILLDVMLPFRDGFEVCRELRRLRVKTSIIMLTARTQEAEKILGLEFGADDYVTKPFSPAELRARIKAVISEGAFSGYRRIAREKMDALWLTWPVQWPASFLFSDRYAAEDAAAALAPVPLLVVHGTGDIVVPPSHAQRLYDAAREPRELWLVPGRHVAAFTTQENRERLLAYMAARGTATGAAR